MIKNIVKIGLPLVLAFTTYSCQKTAPCSPPGFKWKSVLDNQYGSYATSWWTDKTGAYLVGYGNLLYHTADGTVWTYSMLPIEFTSTGVEFFGWGDSPNDIYIGYGNRVIHFNGITWTTSLTLPSNEIVYAGIAGTNQSDVYVMAETVSTFSPPYQPPLPIGLKLYHFTGSSWTSTTVPLNNNSIADTSDISVFGFDVYIALDVNLQQPLLLHYNGSTWSSESFPDISLHVAPVISIDSSVFGFNKNDLYTIVGWNFGSAVLHFTGSGWTILGGVHDNVFYGRNCAPYRICSAIWGANDNDLYIDGFSNSELVVSHFDGQQWNNMDVADMSANASTYILPLGLYGLSPNIFMQVAWYCIPNHERPVSLPPHLTLLKEP